MSRIKRPLRKFFTAGRAARRFLWWWVQDKNANKEQPEYTGPGYPPIHSPAWNDSDNWYDPQRWAD